MDYSTGKGGATYDPAKLVNSSKNNTGIADLPAARPALVWYPYNATNAAFPTFSSGSTMASMLGPVYRYDPSNPSSAKLPSYYDGKLFIFDFHRSLIHTVQVDKDGILVKVERFWDQTSSNPIQNPIDCKVGPDGALYFLDWADDGAYPHNSGHGNLVKLEYTGPSEPLEPRPARSLRADLPGWTLLPPGTRWAPAASAVSAEAFDARGRTAWAWRRGSALPQGASPDILRVRVETSARP